MKLNAFCNHLFLNELKSEINFNLISSTINNFIYFQTRSFQLKFERNDFQNNILLNTEENQYIRNILKKRNEKEILNNYFETNNITNYEDLNKKLTRAHWKELLLQSGLSKNQIQKFIQNKQQKIKKQKITKEKIERIREWIVDTQNVTLKEISNELNLSTLQVSSIKFRIKQIERLQNIKNNIIDYFKNKTQNNEINFSEILNNLTEIDLENLSNLLSISKSDIYKIIYQSKKKKFISKANRDFILSQWNNWIMNHEYYSEILNIKFTSNHPFIKLIQKDLNLNASQISRILIYNLKSKQRNRKIINDWIKENQKYPNETEFKFLQDSSGYKKHQLKFILSYQLEDKSIVTRDKKRTLFFWYNENKRMPNSEEMKDFKMSLNLHENQIKNIFRNFKNNRVKRLTKEDQKLIFDLLKNNSDAEKIENTRKELNLTDKQLKYLINKYNISLNLIDDENNEQYKQIQSKKKIKTTKVTSKSRFIISKWILDHPKVNILSENDVESIKDITNLSFKEIKRIFNQIKSYKNVN